MATVSDKPWSQFSQADYSPEQWRRACLVDTGQGDVDSKDRYKLPVREPDGTLNRNGVHAAAGGHGISQVQGISAVQRQIAARKLYDLYENELNEEPPDSLEKLAGISEAADQAEDARDAGRSRTYHRVWPLEGIEILSRAKGGDGRTVEAYAAAFDREAEIHDGQGHYRESIDRTAFNRTLSHGISRTMVLYNHGLNVVDGKPNPLAQVPIGKPVEIRPDGKGLLTVTRYNNSELADSVLESIKNGDITGQSFRGTIYRSNPQRVPKARAGQPLPLVVRMELGLSDYGPTPQPYYPDATIEAVRSVRQILAEIDGLPEDQRVEVLRTLRATSLTELGSEDSRTAHSARLNLLRIRAEAALIGV